MPTLSQNISKAEDALSGIPNGLRVLYLGELWFGSCTRACSSALRRLGCDVLELDPQLPIRSSCRTITARILARVMRPQIAREYNSLILASAKKFEPDFVLAFKGLLVEASTLRVLRQQGVPLYNYYPDRVILESRTGLGRSLSEYDCMFDTKRAWDGDASTQIKVRARMFLPHGYDRDVHRPVQLNAKDEEQYGCDVSLIAGYSPLKEDMLSRLVRLRPDLDLRIWGDGWSRCKSKALQKYVQGWAPFGDQYARAIQATRINLAIMGVTAEVHDLTSTRTYEIPACGGFMLHERNAEVLGLYDEDKETACFESPEELAEKINYYLAHPKERTAIAKAGYVRCVPAYSYDHRVAEIVGWHRQRNLQKAATSC